MRRTLIIVGLALLLGVSAALGTVALQTDNRESFSMDTSKPITLDFGNAYLNVIAWDEDHVVVAHTDRSVRAGLRGDIRQEGNMLVLENFVAPNNSPVTVQYGADSWLPLIQFDRYRVTHTGMPYVGDYTVFVPRHSIIDVRAATAVIMGCNVVHIQGTQITVLDSNLVDGFVAAIGEEVTIRRSKSSSTVTTIIDAGIVTIRDSQLGGIEILSTTSGAQMNVEIRDSKAEHVSIHGETADTFILSVRDTSMQSLGLFYNGNTGVILLRDNTIAAINNQTSLDIETR